MSRPSDPVTTASFSLRLTSREPDVAGCFVELHADGSVVLVVDGERLFQFDSLDALLAQYDLARGPRQPSMNGDAVTAQEELAAAELAATLAVATIDSRPRAEKALLDARIARAIARVRVARARLRAAP